MNALNQVLAVTTCRALLIVGLSFSLAPAAPAAEIVFPADPRAILNVKTDLGAKGDGLADNTAAIQAGIERSARTAILYFPTGVYRITRPLVFRRADGREGSMIGPWLYGQDRDKTILRLADDAPGFNDPARPLEAIRAQARPDGARMNADFFDRTLVNLTIDTGNNPGATAIKFYSNNTGLMQHIRIRGNGACGIDLGFNDQNGPLLIQDVEIDGFAIGIQTNRILNAQTLSRITIRNARQVGVLHRGQVMAFESLHILNAPLAIDSGGNGVLSLLDCRFEAAPNAAGPAIRLAKGHLYAARIATTGFGSSLASDTPSGNLAAANIAEYASHPAIPLGPGSPPAGVLLKPPAEPNVPLPARTDDWVCANDFGAKIRDNDDDGPAIQKAIDEAARKGASTVYLLPSTGGDPNWYMLKSNVRVHGSVQRIMGLAFVRILGGDSADPNYPENLSRFIVDDDPAGAKTVVFQNLQVFAPRPSFGIEVRSPSRTVLCQNSGGTLIARPNATAFLTNCVGHAYQEKGSKVWARQWNTEGGPKVVGVNTRNDGGHLWILGMKTEATSTKVATLNGGRTEILGVHNYNTDGAKDPTPFFLVRDASLSVAGYREINFTNSWWKIPVRFESADQVYTHPSQPWQTWSLLRAGK